MISTVTVRVVRQLASLCMIYRHIPQRGKYVRNVFGRGFGEFIEEDKVANLGNVRVTTFTVCRLFGYLTATYLSCYT